MTGRTSRYRGARGLEEHVGRMDIREGEAGMADTGRCADGVGVGKGSKKEVSFYALVLVRIHPPSIASMHTSNNLITGVVGG